MFLLQQGKGRQGKGQTLRAAGAQRPYGKTPLPPLLVKLGQGRLPSRTAGHLRREPVGRTPADGGRRGEAAKAAVREGTSRAPPSTPAPRPRPAATPPPPGPPRGAEPSEEAAASWASPPPRCSPHAPPLPSGRAPPPLTSPAPLPRSPAAARPPSPRARGAEVAGAHAQAASGGAGTSSGPRGCPGPAAPLTGRPARRRPPSEENKNGRGVRGKYRRGSGLRPRGRRREPAPPLGPGLPSRSGGGQGAPGPAG